MTGGSEPLPTRFSRGLRAAIAKRGLTLGSLSRQLEARGYHVSVSALSHWSSGRRRPERPDSAEVIEALEDILGLMPGDLSELLGRPRARGRAPLTGEFAQGMLEKTRFQRALRALGFDDVRVYPHMQAIHFRAYIGPDGADRQYVFTHVVRAVADGAVRIASVHTVPGEPVCDFEGRDDFFACINGGEFGRQIYWEDENLIGAEIVIEKNARRGQVFVVRHVIDLPKNFVTGSIDFSTPRKVREILLEVFFDGTPPERIVEFSETGEVSAEVSLDPAPSVTSLHQDVGPGVVGVRWQ